MQAVRELVAELVAEREEGNEGGPRDGDHHWPRVPGVVLGPEAQRNNPGHEGVEERDV